VRFLQLLDEGVEDGPDPAADALGIGFQLKLLALAGYLPHLGSCASCGAPGPLAAYSARAGGAVCARCAADAGTFRLRDGSAEAIAALVDRPLAPGRVPAGVAADAVRVVEETYAHHGGFRLRTLHA